MPPQPREIHLPKQHKFCSTQYLNRFLRKPETGVRHQNPGLKPERSLNTSRSVRLSCMQRSIDITSLRGPWSAASGSSVLSSWLMHARYGTCGVTGTMDNGCKAGATKGVWKPRRRLSHLGTITWCLRQCASCQGCKHVTVSHILSECSWFETCEYDNPVAIDGPGSIVTTEMFISGPAVDSSRPRNDLDSHGADDDEPPDGPDPSGAAVTADTSLGELGRHQPPAKMLDFGLPVGRFAPATFEQAMASVYTMWNILDRMVLQINNTEPWSTRRRLSSRRLASSATHARTPLLSRWRSVRHVPSRAG